MPKVTIALHLRGERSSINPILFEFYPNAMNIRMHSGMSFHCPNPVVFQLHCTAPRMHGIWLFTKWTLNWVGCIFKIFLK